MDPEIKQTVVAIATTHQLDPALICALCEHESRWDTWAIRYEPSFQERWVPRAGLDPTEYYSRAFSYGLMQIMGQTARELLYMGPYLSELCDPKVGIEFGCRKLAHCLKNTAGNIAAALEQYNGGADPKYAAIVMALIPKYQ